MFDWLGDIIGGIGDAIGSVFSFLGEQISNVIFDTILQWFYTIIYNAVADFFTMMGNMGAEIFDLEWVDATFVYLVWLGTVRSRRGGCHIRCGDRIPKWTSQHQDDRHQHPQGVLRLFPDRRRTCAAV